jgi:hypothetical protein
MQKGERVMSENGLSDLLKLIRLIVGNESSGFTYSPPIGIAAEAVCLRACAAQFHRNRVSFCRQRDPATSVSDAPGILHWRLQHRTKGDQFVWSVDRLDGEFTTEELARAILDQLRDYCENYEESIGSFSEPGQD